jgi:hypothetical protein
MGPRLAVRAAFVCAAVAVVVGLFAGAATAGVALRITIVGEGKVLREGAPGSECPPACQLLYFNNEQVTEGLLAVPADGWSFAEWTVTRAEYTLDAPPFPFCSTAPLCVFHIPMVLGPCNCVTPITAFDDVTVTFVPTPAPTAPPAQPVVRPPDGAFLCYSRFQVDPGVWPEAEASALLAKGYWRPTAVPGAVSATRLGPYSLICNPPNVARVIDHGFVDDGGASLAGVGDPWLGLYPLAS